EAVEEDRARAPGVGPAAQRPDRRRRQGMLVVAAQLVAEPEVGLIEARDLELVVTGLGRPFPQRGRIDHRRLQLADQLLERSREARTAGGGREQPELSARGCLAGQPTPLRPAQRRAARAV